jgi:hypothetical protein
MTNVNTRFSKSSLVGATTRISFLGSARRKKHPRQASPSSERAENCLLDQLFPNVRRAGVSSPRPQATASLRACARCLRSSSQRPRKITTGWTRQRGAQGVASAARRLNRSSHPCPQPSGAGSDVAGGHRNSRPLVGSSRSSRRAPMHPRRCTGQRQNARTPAPRLGLTSRSTCPLPVHRLFLSSAARRGIASGRPIRRFSRIIAGASARRSWWRLTDPYA